MPKLTKKIVDASKPNASEYFVWDGDLPGYGLRIFPSGKKSYMVQYRRNGRTRRVTIGLHGTFTPDSARTEAVGLLASIAKGGDPSGDRAKARSDLTVRELCILYLKDGCKTKKQSTIATDEGRIERHINPLIGNLPVIAVSKADIIRFAKDVTNGKTATVIKTKKWGKARVKGGSGTAARTLGLLGGIFSYAIGHLELITANPVHGVARAKDNKLSRFLTIGEIQRLGTALAQAEAEGTNPYAIAAIRLLLLTGCRRSEILTLKWAEVDWGNSCLRLQDSKTGAKVVPIGSAALDVLKSVIHVENNPYVLPAMRGKAHYVGVQKDWDHIRRLAELIGVRLHDLRRTFASTAALQGQSLLTIGKLLGHVDPKTTQIYAHLSEFTIQKAAENTSNEISERLNGKIQNK